MSLIPNLTSGTFGPWGAVGKVASSIGGPAQRGLIRVLGGTPASAASDAAPPQSAAKLRYEHDEARVKQLDEDCRNDLRGLSLCAITALFGASAFMQGAIIFWPVAVLMVWGACEAGWTLACAWRAHRKAYDVAVDRRSISMDAWAEEEDALKQTTHQQAYADAARASQKMGERLLVSPAFALREPRAASATRAQNR